MKNRKRYTRRQSLGIVLLAFAPLLLGFLCFPLVAPAPTGVATPVPVAVFAPTVSASVPNNTPSAPSDVVVHLSVPAGSTLPIGAAFEVPAGWTVARDVSVMTGSVVGSVSGSMTVADPFYFVCNTGVVLNIDLMDAATATSPTVAGTDTDSDGVPQVIEDNNGNGLPDGVDKYPAFLNTLMPGTHWARYFGHTEAGGLSNLYVNVVVTRLAPGGPYRVTTIVNDPTAPPESAASQFCAPQSVTLTLSGTSADNPDTGITEGGQTVYRNPTTSGSYTFGASLVSEFDKDNDGVSNGLDNCPASANTSQADGDQDYVGDACDFNDSVPDGPNYYMTCADPVGIGQGDPGGATCVQGAPTPPPTATPRPVGGIAELPEIAKAPLDAPESSALSTALLAAIAAAAGAAALALGAAWYVRGHRLR